VKEKERKEDGERKERDGEREISDKYLPTLDICTYL
jgi:hypothetical protein